MSPITGRGILINISQLMITFGILVNSLGIFFYEKVQAYN